jgi:alkylhydroperoxidase/carboxymuconolactone decarboxylase family protein YurZ
MEAARMLRLTHPFGIAFLIAVTCAHGVCLVASNAIAQETQRAARGSQDAAESEAESRGRAMQRRVYDSIPADDPWLKMSEEQVFAQIWTRPGLSLRDKRLVSLTAAAYAASPTGYISHIEGALDNGDLTPAELWEWLIHFTQYAGYPKAAPVWVEIRIALAKRGILPLPASLGPGRDPELDRERAKPRPAPAPGSPKRP